MSEPTVEEIVALFERSKHGMLTRADTVLLIADWHKRGEEAESIRAKCGGMTEPCEALKYWRHEAETARSSAEAMRTKGK